MLLAIFEPRIFMIYIDLMSVLPMRSRLSMVAESAPYSRNWLVPKAVPMVTTDVTPLARMVPKRSSVRERILKGCLHGHEEGSQVVDEEPVGLCLLQLSLHQLSESL